MRKAGPCNESNLHLKQDSATQSHISRYNGIGYYLLYLLFADVAKKLYLEA